MASLPEEVADQQAGLLDMQLLMIPVHLICCSFQISVQSSSHSIKDINVIIPSSWYYSLL
jgi:hypothetical protein